jgi:nuclease HARBI1
LGNIRITEEWSYAELKGRFSFLEAEHMLKIEGMPVSKMLIAALILRNAHTCMNGSEISAFYDCQPPSLQDWTARGPSPA